MSIFAQCTTLFLEIMIPKIHIEYMTLKIEFICCFFFCTFNFNLPWNVFTRTESISLFNCLFVLNFISFDVRFSGSRFIYKAISLIKQNVFFFSIFALKNENGADDDENTCLWIFVLLCVCWLEKNEWETFAILFILRQENEISM